MVQGKERVKIMVGIIDYGVGNLSSIKFAINRLGVDAEIVKDPSNLDLLSHLILPGVGSFAYAMQKIRKKKWDNAILKFVASNKPILGICLGMQLLFEYGEEGGNCSGLGLIAGKVKLMAVSEQLKLPHVGWNQLKFLRSHPIFSNIREGVDFYFTHSYQCIPTDPQVILASCEYGEFFPAVVEFKNIMGMQFHPEKSQPAGLKILKNFLQ